MNILEEAESLINGERQQQYGGATESFSRIADLWGSYLDADVSPLDVANLMILLKVSRAHDEYHRDSYVDIAGYAALGERLHDEAVAEDRQVGVMTVDDSGNPVKVPRVWESVHDIPPNTHCRDADETPLWINAYGKYRYNNLDYNVWNDFEETCDEHFPPFTEVLESE